MMSAMRYRNLLRRLWWLLLICTLAGVFGGFIGGVRLFPVYQAVARLQADVRSPDPSTNVMLANDRVVRTLALDASSADLLQSVAAKYPGLSTSRLASEVTSAPVTNTSAFTITVQDADPFRAASLANAISAQVIVRWQTTLAQQNSASQQPIRNELATLAAQIVADGAALKALGTPPSDAVKAASLQTQMTALQQQYQQELQTLSRIQVAEAAQPFQISIVQHATPPNSPLVSRLIVDTAAGGLLGALGGLVLIFGIGSTRRRLQSATRVADLSGWPVLLEFERVKSTRSAPEGGHMTDDTLGQAATALIRSLDFLSVDRPLRVIVVTSASRSGAASAIAGSLAIYLSAGGRRTLLADARLLNGTQARQFGVPLVPGLSDAALAAKFVPGGSLTLEGYLHEPTRMHAPFLRVLPSGTVPPNPGRLLASRPLAASLSALVASEAEMIVIDAPPLLDPAQAQALARVADGFLPVIDLRDTTIERLLRLQAALADAGATVLGCVVSHGGYSGGVVASNLRAEPSGAGASTSGKQQATSAARFLPTPAPRDTAQGGRARRARP